MSFFRKPSSLRAACAAALALLACAAAPMLPAQAGAYTFSNPNSQRTINAGIVLLDSTIDTMNSALGPDNPDPYVFYILSRRVDLLPVGWTIQNPLAAHNVAADVQARWTARANSTTAGATFVSNNGGQAYQFGQNETPGMAAYWEVPLSKASTQDLQQFDVLLVDLANGKIGDFRPTEVEKLRRFVDGGGTLLVEDTGVTATSATPGGGRINMPVNGITYGPLFFPLQFTGGATGTASLPSLAYRHPILNVPYYLAQNELNALGNGFTGDIVSAASPEFTPVLADTANNKVVAAESFGAGAIVASSTGFVAAINNAVTAGSIPTTSGPNSGPYSGTNFQAAPTQDLKFLCNIISWVGGHGHEHQNSHQTGETLSALPSPVRSWNFVPKSSDPAIASNAPGATISGNFVYSTDSAGTLHAFDLYPYEDLDGDGYPDDGVIPDYSQGSSCDEVWRAGVGKGASSPTVATPPLIPSPAGTGKSGTAYVFVESNDGTIQQFVASTVMMPTGMSIGPSGSGSFVTKIPPIIAGGNSLLAPAPAPTYYEGRLYASEPDGTLYVKDFGASGSATGGISIKLLSPTMSGPAIPTGAPAVGGIASTGVGDAVTPQSTDNVAIVPTSSGLYSLFLGARGEQLQGTATTFTANHVPSPTATIDGNAPYRAYSLPPATVPANGYANLEGSGPPATGLTPSGRTFSGTPTQAPPIYADYDVTFDPAVSLTRSIVTFGGTPSGSEIMSTPALDRFGNASYFASEPGATAYQTLASFHDAVRGPILNWRFRLPASADVTGTGQVITDADGTNYSPLEDMNFQGKPVSDSRGFVYALASGLPPGSNTPQTAILCFNSQTPITTAPLGLDASTASLTQNEFSGVSTPLLSTQYTQNGIGGSLTLTNFGATTGSQPTVLAPNLNEPQPILVTAATTANANVGQQELLLHTNLAWYSILKTNGADIAVTAGEGITKVGSTLFFVGNATGGTGSHLYSVPTDPQAAGYTIASKFVDATQIVSGNSFVTDNGDTGAGATSAVASGANGALIINGASGVSAFLNRTTLVTDSTRVMELNQDGTASWLADSTQGSIGQGTTSLQFSRPSSVTELTPNDYLVADTGNNRCVRFDRAGKVVWELSRFADTQDVFTTVKYGKTGPLLSASEPNTLNQPTSVQIRQSVETGGTNNYTVVHYLVSDTGNFRILDIVDVYDATGKPIGTPHNLVWISHTHDQQHRDYRYQSAAYFTAPNGTTGYIVALVTNQRVAQLLPNAVPGTLNPAAQDSPGGSLVLLNYDPTAPTINGDIATIIDHFQAYITSAGTFDLTTALTHAGAATPNFIGGSPTTLYLRNPRFLKAYTPAGSTAATKGPNLLLADDNGVWDLAYDAGKIGVGARPAQYFTQWGFTQVDYQALGAKPKAPITGIPLVSYNRGIIPFVPQSIQRTATDQVIIGAGTHSIGRYLVTNGYSNGNADNLNDKPYDSMVGDTSLNNNPFGGEVFELFVPSIPTGSTNVLETDITNPLSRITNTGPLAQPTFAYRLQ